MRTPSDGDRLLELNEVHAMGLISDAEMQAKREAVLKEMEGGRARGIVRRSRWSQVDTRGTSLWSPRFLPHLAGLFVLLILLL